MKFTDAAIKALESKDKTVDYTADGFPGFKIQVTPKGTKTFYYIYTTHEGKRVRYKIGRYLTAVSLKSAKEQAAVLAGQVAAGRDPQAEKKQRRAQATSDSIQAEKEIQKVLRRYLDQVYYPYARQEHRAFNRTYSAIEHNFKWLMETQIDQIEPFDVERWKTERKKSGTKPATVNRALSALKTALNYAVNVAQLIDKNPLAEIKPLKTTSSGVVRYLSEDEKTRLNAVLETKEGHLPVIVKVLMNTGIRPAECFGLKWEDINFDTQKITLHAAYTKSGKTRHPPMNQIVVDALKEWKKQSNHSKWVFPSPMTGSHIVSIQRAFRKLLEEAKISNFRLYDFRHDFASTLAMKGVSLYLISELLGHSDPNITKIYAHLSPDYLQSTVELLS